MKLQIENLVNDNNNHAVNQFVIKLNGNIYFQSYDTIIAKKDKDGQIVLCKDWDYSKTTKKHLYIWLRDFTTYIYLKGEDDVREAIACGAIKVKKSIKYK